MMPGGFALFMADKECWPVIFQMAPIADGRPLVRIANYSAT
jgi:hypothetical protein